jgi:hypothetical protein
LFYDKRFQVIYDLKGNQRGRHIEPSGKPGEVLLDANLEKSALPSPSHCARTVAERRMPAPPSSAVEPSTVPARLQQEDPPLGAPQRQCVRGPPSVWSLPRA